MHPTWYQSFLIAHISSKLERMQYLCARPRLPNERLYIHSENKIKSTRNQILIIPYYDHQIMLNLHCLPGLYQRRFLQELQQFQSDHSEQPYVVLHIHSILNSSEYKEHKESIKETIFHLCFSIDKTAS